MQLRRFTTSLFLLVLLLSLGCGTPDGAREEGENNVPSKTSEKSVSVRGTELVYWESGGASDPVLLYIHGNTGSKIWFEEVMDMPGYRTVAPDLPNFGASDHIDRADIDLYAVYIAEFMMNLDIKDAYVVGHSLGGAVAISLTTRYPGLVSRLLLVDSASLEGLHTPEEYYPVIESYKDNPALMKEALRAVTPTMEDESRLDRLTESAMRMNPIAFTGHPRALDRFDYRNRVGEVAIPVKVVRGELDAIITEEMARSTAAGFANGSFELLPGVGHSVMVEDPDRFAKLVTEFGRNE
jgi:branched-chain amino acid transport system permease protein